MRSLALLLSFILLPVAQAAEIFDAPERVQPLLIGSSVPDVIVRSVDGQDVRLREAVAGKPTALIFYRGGWCPYCNMQLSGLRLIQQNLATLGYQVLAISADRPEALRETLAKQPLGYTLLSDSKLAASKAFGIAFRLDDATVQKYREFNIDLEQASGETHHALPVPSVFVLDAEGVIQFQYVNPDYRVRVPQDVLLAAAVAVIEGRK